MFSAQKKLKMDIPVYTMVALAIHVLQIWAARNHV